MPEADSQAAPPTPFGLRLAVTSGNPYAAGLGCRGNHVIGLALQVTALIFAVNLALCFLPPIVVFTRAFFWGRDRSWTNYPNLNGLLIAITVAGLWLSTSWSIVVQAELRPLLPITDVVFTRRSDSYFPLWLGMTNLGLLAVAVGVLLTIGGWLLQFLRWLFVPRRHR